MKAISVALVSSALLLAGCATPVDWAATGGSRSDGVIQVSYDYYDLQMPVADDAQAQGIAFQRCRAWGYTGAEPFGGEIRQCAEHDSVGCSRWMVTREFQCTGTGSSANP